MLTLQRAQFPSSKDELTDAIDAALRRYVRKPGRIVTARSRVFPYFDEITIDLDGAQLESFRVVSGPIAEQTRPACEAAIVTLNARKFSVQGAPLNVRLEAHHVVFHQGQDANGDAVLLVHKAQEGSALISASQSDLERAIAEIVGAEARRRGITVEHVRLSLRARGARSVAAQVQLRVRKFLLRGTIEICGQLDIDEDFVAKLLNLTCKGNGALGAIACTALEPHLRRLDNCAYPLLSLPLGEVKLSDVRIAVADMLEISADFQSAIA